MLSSLRTNTTRTQGSKFIIAVTRDKCWILYKGTWPSLLCQIIVETREHAEEIEALCPTTSLEWKKGKQI